MLRIGISPRFLLGDPQAYGSYSVDRLAIVDAVNQLVSQAGALPLGLPLLRELEGEARARSLAGLAAGLDGLVLQGGTDVDPERYQEVPLRPEWSGDPVRDRLELDLVRAFRALDKPILGICRGFQVLNVAFGGSLYQDLPTQTPSEVQHDLAAGYCAATHSLQLLPDSWLASWYGCTQARVNSAHHQGIKALAPGLLAEAVSEDGLVEAFRARSLGFVFGVQWNPELHHRERTLLAAEPLLAAFIAACAGRRAT